MARVTLTVQEIVRTGLNPSYGVAEADGNAFANTDPGRRFVHVKNGGGAQITVTVVTPQTINGLGVADLTVDVPASGERMIGPFPPSSFNQGDGLVHVDYSDVTSVTVAALKIA